MSSQAEECSSLGGLLATHTGLPMVDKDCMMVEALDAHLSRVEHEVHRASDGADGLRKLFATRPERTAPGVGQLSYEGTWSRFLAKYPNKANKNWSPVGDHAPPTLSSSGWLRVRIATS